MHKLEEVLRAEEAARHTLADARQRAASLLHDADAEAKRISHDILAAAKDQAAEQRHQALTDAQAQAKLIEDESDAALAQETDRCSARLTTAVEAALGKLMG